MHLKQLRAEFGGEPLAKLLSDSQQTLVTGPTVSDGLCA